MSKSWEQTYFDMIEALRGKSKDPSSQFASLIVGTNHEIRSTGFNGFPRGVKDSPERYANREIKYKLVVHAEQNAILNAARVGIPLDGCILYVDSYPCSNCAKSIIQAGIVEVVLNGDSVIHNDEGFKSRWKDEIDTALGMFEEAGVKIRIFKKETNG